MRPLVVIPTYDEAENIVEAVERTRAAVPGAAVLVVDDDSPDGTAEVVERLAAARPDCTPPIDLLRRPGKQGLGSAYRAGFAWGMARGHDVLVEMDADLSHDPAALVSLLRAVDDGADLAIGSRYVAGGSIPDWAWHRKALSKWGNRYASAMLGLSVADATAGYRAYRASLLERLDLASVRADGYGFQIEMTHRSAARGARIVEVPIAFTDRTKGSSKMSSRIIVEALALVTWWGIVERVPFRR